MKEETCAAFPRGCDPTLTRAHLHSELTRFAIITDKARKVKIAVIDWRLTPTVAVNDPLCMLGMPASLTAATGMDALTHAVEAYVSTASTPVTDACALAAIKLVSRFLRRAVQTPGDIEARDMMVGEGRGGVGVARRACAPALTLSLFGGEEGWREAKDGGAAGAGAPAIPTPFRSLALRPTPSTWQEWRSTRPAWATCTRWRTSW